MKATLEFELPGELEELETAARATEWKRAVDEICERILGWRYGKPEPFPGRPFEQPMEEMETVLECIRNVLAERNLPLD
jgi:hypothetical protein